MLLCIRCGFFSVIVMLLVVCYGLINVRLLMELCLCMFVGFMLNCLLNVCVNVLCEL